MAGDAYGGPDPTYGRWQQILNESWPATTRHQWTYAAQPVDVTARIVWERDGEQRFDGHATRWTGRHVYVEFADPRLSKTGAWVDAADVVRR